LKKLKKPKKSIKRKTLIKKLDAAFSQYIRWRDADADGLIKCISCDTKKHVSKMHCGHLFSRRHYSIRWHPKNSAGQCPACNLYDQGRQWVMAKEIDIKHGDGTAEKMYKRSQDSRKYTNEELIQLIIYYKTKADDMQNKHC
tara:strand:+ start:816 stop:1241 length:426 start_codon:yes stop_codon:yes gene_type:complete